jgi:multicomponent Na+:H+ antiporter subunit G
MTEILATIVGMAFVLAGVVFAVIGSIGVLRLPDFYTRMHAASKLDTLSLGLCMVGLAVLQGPDLNAVKLILIFVFASIANPAAANALGRSAFRAGLEPWSRARRAKKGRRS